MLPLRPMGAVRTLPSDLDIYGTGTLIGGKVVGAALIADDHPPSALVRVHGTLNGLLEGGEVVTREKAMVSPQTAALSPDFGHVATQAIPATEGGSGTSPLVHRSMLIVAGSASVHCAQARVRNGSANRGTVGAEGGRSNPPFGPGMTGKAIYAHDSVGLAGKDALAWGEAKNRARGVAGEALLVAKALADLLDLWIGISLGVMGGGPFFGDSGVAFKAGPRTFRWGGLGCGGGGQKKQKNDSPQGGDPGGQPARGLAALGHERSSPSAST